MELEGGDSAAFNTIRQTLEKGRWVTEPLVDQSKEDGAKTHTRETPPYFSAYERRDPKRHELESYTWIEPTSSSLLSALKLLYPRISSLYDVRPGVDARNLYDLFIRKSTAVTDTSPVSLRHLQTYLRKVYGRIEERLAEYPRGYVSWHLLWCFFDPGNVVEITHHSSGRKMAMVVERWYFASEASGRAFVVDGHYYQWAGTSMQKMASTKRIAEFTDLQALHTLQVSPITDVILGQLRERGMRYLQYTSQVYALYIGSFYSRAMGGATRMNAEGPVMVDVTCFRKTNPVQDEWADDVNNPAVANIYVKNAASASQIESNFDAAMVHLLPPVIHGFSFRVKRWGEFLIDNLHPYEWQDKSFEHLVIPDAHRRVLSSLVKIHASPLRKSLLTDVIQGKGEGLVIALHGSPGTGKTLTAEAIAEHLKRPLYSISSGELGTTPAGLEKELKNLMELASQWNAVLLIDEADLFLEKRTTNQLERNALVGIFLRLLEYFSGILLLTTNRIDSFDEAFKSRFAVILEYKELDVQSRYLLWSRFLKKAACVVDEDCIAMLAEKQINGRVIKRTIQTAQALALNDKQVLGFRHLEEALLLQ